ncbi:hypothetical protein D3C74_268440 [compost metagenome]
MRQEARHVTGIGRKPEREHLGSILHNLRAFEWIVIDKNEAVQAQIQILCHLLQVFRFSSPIDRPVNKMLLFEQHVGMLIKNRPDIRFIIFAANGQKLPLLRPFQHPALQKLVMSFNLNSERPVLSANTPPQCMIAIQRNHFKRCRRH